VNNTYGILDMRAAVTVLERNIRIIRGPDANNWGYRVLIYAYLDQDNVTRAGSANLQGV
jgi:hypothetical protein